MEPCVRQSDKRRSVANIKYIQNHSPESRVIFQVTFNAELLMMPKDKDVQVVLLEQ